MAGTASQERTRVKPAIRSFTARSSTLGGKGSSPCAVLCFFPRLTCRELDQKWDIWDSGTHLKCTHCTQWLNVLCCSIRPTKYFGNVLNAEFQTPYITVFNCSFKILIIVTSNVKTLLMMECFLMQHYFVFLASSKVNFVLFCLG